MHPGTLYIVGTPLGNLEDMTFRAIRILREVEVIAAEDTRVSGKLLKHFEISTRMMSYHRHSGEERETQVLDLLREGKDVALVTDAGMPCISDPGYALVAACHDAAIPVVPVPGPSAVITALAASGFSTDRFRFLGFLPRARNDRRAMLRESLTQNDTCAAYEAPHRLLDTLADFADLVPIHPLFVARELTKKFEELRRGTAAELTTYFTATPVRGEIALVWPGSGLRATTPEQSLAQAITLAQGYLQAGSSARDAADRAAAETGLHRRAIYQALIHQRI